MGNSIVIKFDDPRTRITEAIETIFNKVLEERENGLIAKILNLVDLESGNNG